MAHICVKIITGADVCIATGAAIQASYIVSADSDKVQVILRFVLVAVFVNMRLRRPEAGKGVETKEGDRHKHRDIKPGHKETEGHGQAGINE